MQTSHGFEERISGMDDAMEPTLEIVTTSLPATRHMYTLQESTTSSEESNQNAKQCNWKMQLNFTAHWLCHHELFIKMCNAQRFVTTNQLYQHSSSLSNQPQYNSGARSGMLTSYNIHTTGIQSIESPTYYIMIIITILIIIITFLIGAF